MKFKLSVLFLEGRDVPSAVSEPLALDPVVAANFDTGHNPVEHTSATTAQSCPCEADNAAIDQEIADLTKQRGDLEEKHDEL